MGCLLTRWEMEKREFKFKKQKTQKKEIESFVRKAVEREREKALQRAL